MSKEKREERLERLLDEEVSFRRMFSIAVRRALPEMLRAQVLVIEDDGEVMAIRKFSKTDYILGIVYNAHGGGLGGRRSKTSYLVSGFQKAYSSN